MLVIQLEFIVFLNCIRLVSSEVIMAMKKDSTSFQEKYRHWNTIVKGKDLWMERVIQLGYDHLYASM